MRGKAVALRVFLAQQKIFTQKFLLLRSALDQQIQMLQIHRLLNEIVGAFLHGGHGFFHRTVGRNQNDGNGRIGLLGFAQHVDSGAAGKLQVGQNQHVAARANLGDGGRTVRGFVHGVAGALQSLLSMARSSGLSSTRRRGSIDFIVSRIPAAS